MLTVAAGRKGSVRRFPDKLYYEYADASFGTEVVESMDLCEMKACAVANSITRSAIVNTYCHARGRFRSHLLRSTSR